MSAQARRDEILAKKAKLAELKRQREQRQKELQTSRQSLDAGPSTNLDDYGHTRGTSRTSVNHADLDSLISSLVDRPSTQRGRESSAGVSTSESKSDTVARETTRDARPIQSLGLAQLRTVYSAPAEVKREVITYSKGIQTDGVPERDQSRPRSGPAGSDSETDGPGRRRRRLSQLEIQRQKEDELRTRLRKEIEEETKAVAQGKVDDQERFPVRELTNDELNAVTGNEDFLDFVERSSKVIERALEEEYDVLTDYAMRANGTATDDDDDTTSGVRRNRRIKQVLQLHDEKHTRRRMVSDLDFSHKYPELLLASYTKQANAPQASPGLALVWNSHMPSRPEYTFTATSDILCARFSPFHPNLLLAGTYSGQICLFDTRSRSSSPVSLTPLAGEAGGHAHPIYSLSAVGTQNASNIISVSTDGTFCAWSFDMLSRPQETLLLTPPPGTRVARSDDVAPTCIAFPRHDPTFFLAGTEEGPLLPVHRYDRAGGRAGVDQRHVYRGHAAPVTGLAFHPSPSPKADLSDLALSCGLDWTVRLWRVRAHGSAAAAHTEIKTEKPLLEIVREEPVYDVKWSPTRPGVFGCVDGSGRLDVFDLLVDTEVPVASATPSEYAGAAGEGAPGRSLNRIAWEHGEGKKVAVGGLDGVVTVFEVGSELGGHEGLARDDWSAFKKSVTRWDRARET